MKIWLTVNNNTENLIPIEIYPDWEIGTVQAVIEAEAHIPVANQLLIAYGSPLTDNTKTVQQCGINDGDILSVVNNNEGGSNPSSSSNLNTSVSQMNDYERIRQQLINDPTALARITQSQPELAAAAHNDPQKFATLFGQLQKNSLEAERKRAQELAVLESDPFNVEAQKKIEELINQELIMKNMYEALEHNPESFAQVNMLYIDINVNEHPIKAFVDSGAQATIMSMDLVEKCGLTRLVDKRFKGIAQGVGTSQFLGRIHNVGMKFADDLIVPCSITVLESCSVGFLLGLDMLKRHTACIDLKKNGLIMYDKFIPFLPEHQIPKSQVFNPDAAQNPAQLGTSSAPTAPSAQIPTQLPSMSQPKPPSGGASIANLKAQYCPKESIDALKNLGATEDQAIRFLIQARGNVEIAASLLFQ